MFTDKCPKCDREITNKTQTGLKVGMAKHIWWHDHSLKPRKNNGTTALAVLDRPKRKYTRRKFAHNEVSVAPETSQVITQATMSKEDVAKVIASVFATLTCCPGCGRNLYEAYLGLRRSKQLLSNHENH